MTPTNDEIEKIVNFRNINVGCRKNMMMSISNI